MISWRSFFPVPPNPPTLIKQKGSTEKTLKEKQVKNKINKAHKNGGLKRTIHQTKLQRKNNPTQITV